MPRKKKPLPETGFDQISPDDIVAFAEFLDREPLARRSMSLAMLDGFLTAIVIGPEMVMPSDYMRWIWDWRRGKKGAGFKDLDEANRIMGYLLGMNNRVAVPLMSKRPAVVPVFIFEPGFDHKEWLVGFAMGTEFDQNIWEHAHEAVPGLFEPFAELSRLEREDEGWAAACLDLGKSLVRIRDYFRAGEWREAFEEVQPPVVRVGPKIGRNDPCPCGSGRKFKKCCGESGGAVH